MQTRLEDCEFCGEPALRQAQVVPPVYETRGEGDKRAKVQVKAPVMAWVCVAHSQHVIEQFGWQERVKDLSRKRTREAKERLKRDQLGLFG